MSDLTAAACDVLAERERQRSDEGEGFTDLHDDNYQIGEMAFAAAAYTIDLLDYGSHAKVTGSVNIQRFGRTGVIPIGRLDLARLLWPWSMKWFRSTTPRRNLVKAGALILAEIERIDRLDAKEKPDG